MKQFLIVAAVLATFAAFPAVAQDAGEACSTLGERIEVASADAHTLTPQRAFFMQKVGRELIGDATRCQQILMDETRDVSPHKPREVHWFARQDVERRLG